MNVVDCSPELHAQAILDILNDAILHSTALYDYQPRTLEMMQTWFETKRKHLFPVIGIESEQGELLGFASYGTFRAWPAYKYTVEHSIYVHRNHRGLGLGRKLLSLVIERAEQQDYHVLIGGIDASNSGSIALHEKFGFEHCGTIRQAGFKFDRWLDLAFYQLVLKTPRQPQDG